MAAIKDGRSQTDANAVIEKMEECVDGCLR
jgi:hypothetical protein